MIRLGRVSRETKGVAVLNWFEDEARLIEGDRYPKIG